jgi:hypothetical protein
LEVSCILKKNNVKMRQILWVFLWVHWSITISFAQNNPPLLTVCNSTCTGNLGENSFSDGDFGAGQVNILPTNPGLAPGYQYNFNPPPDDGFYTITNNTTNWGSFAATAWINIPDNGPESNGYMMVVNASYQPGLFYRKTVSVCENTLYEFSIDVINVVGKNVPGTQIMPNIAFLIDGNVVCETGNIPRDESWRTVRFSFTTVPGQTNVELSLRNNAPGGIGNDLAIDNISFRACGPEIELPAIQFYCAGKSLVLGANLQNSPYSNTVYQWQFAPNSALNWSNLPNANTPSVEIPIPSDSSFFRLVVASSVSNLALPYCSAISSASQPMLENLSDFAITGTDTIVCNGAPGVLFGGTFAQYAWSTGEITSQITAAMPGLYSVTITSAQGCTATDDLDVYEVILEAEATWKDPVCAGDATGRVNAFAIQGGVGPIWFAVDGGMAQTQPDFYQLAAGKHTLVVADSLQCKFIIPFELQDPTPFELSLGPDQQLMEGDSLLLISTFNYTPVQYTWLPAGGLNCKNCPTPLATPFRTTTYTLQVLDQLGCNATDSIYIEVLPNFDIYAPNVFKPDVSENRDNNYFTIFPSKSVVRIQQLKVYNRWGAEIFSRNDLVPGDRALQWDGTDHGERMADAGVYIWKATLVFFDGQVKTYTGDVTLLRQ